MKTLWFLLLIFVPFCFAQRHTREQCLERVNGFRAEMAVERQVANMNELVYNPTLEKKILEQLSIMNGCPKRGMKITRDGFDMYLPVDFFPIDLGAPGITTMACFESFCMENGEKIFSIVSDHSDSSPIFGSPGSQCPDGRYPELHNLCSLGKPEVHSAYIRKGSRDIPKFSDESQKKSGNQYVRKSVLDDIQDAMKQHIPQEHRTWRDENLEYSIYPSLRANKKTYMRKSGRDISESQNEEFSGNEDDYWFIAGDDGFETTEDPLDKTISGSSGVGKPVSTTTGPYDDDDDDWLIAGDDGFETTEDPLDQNVPGSPDVEKPVSTTTDPHDDDDDDNWFIAGDDGFETTEDPLDQTDSGSPDIEKPVSTTTDPYDDDDDDWFIAGDDGFETTEGPLEQSVPGSPAVEKHVNKLSDASKVLFEAANKINCKPPADPFPQGNYAASVAALEKKKKDERLGHPSVKN